MQCRHNLWVSAGRYTGDYDYLQFHNIDTSLVISIVAVKGLKPTPVYLLDYSKIGLRKSLHSLFHCSQLVKYSLGLCGKR